MLLSPAFDFDWTGHLVSQEDVLYGLFFIQNLTSLNNTMFQNLKGILNLLILFSILLSPSLCFLFAL